MEGRFALKNILSRAVRAIARRLPQADTDRPAALQVWLDTFEDVFAVPPTASHIERLSWLSQAGPLTPPRRYRRVLAAFDQQDLHSSMSVRWGPEDVRLREVAGVSLYLDDADLSVAQVIAAGAYEPHLIKFFQLFLREGMKVVDAGANVGLYTMISARAVGPRGRVWSFEPNSENCRFIVASAAANGFENIELFPVALGSERGFVYFTSAIGSNGGMQELAKNNALDPSCRIVPQLRLDDIAIPNLDFMKMDVEGAEALLMQGAEHTLERCRPVIVSEFSDEMLRRISGRDGSRFLQFFADRGFDCFVFDKETHELKPVSDPQAFAREFAGTVRIEDLLLCPAEKVGTLPVGNK